MNNLRISIMLMCIGSLAYASEESNRKEYSPQLKQWLAEHHFSTNPNSIDNHSVYRLIFGKTPLMVATIEDELMLVLELLEHGADPNSKDDLGKSALRIAVEVNKKFSTRIIGHLKKAGADIDALDHYNRTALMAILPPVSLIGMNNDRFQMIHALLESGANPNITNDDGETVLHMAAWRQYPKVVQKLLDYKADPNIQNKLGLTPFSKITQLNGKEYLESARMLLSHKADMTIKTTDWVATSFPPNSTVLELSVLSKPMQDLIHDHRRTLYKSHARAIKKSLIETKLMLNVLTSIVSEYAAEYPFMEKPLDQDFLFTSMNIEPQEDISAKDVAMSSSSSLMALPFSFSASSNTMSSPTTLVSLPDLVSTSDPSLKRKYAVSETTDENEASAKRRCRRNQNSDDRSCIIS